MCVEAMGGAPATGGSEATGGDGSGGEATGGAETGGAGTGGEATGGNGTGGEPIVGDNLISNGDFSSGTSGWEGGDGAPDIDDGRGCRNGGLFGWAGEGSGVTVPAGTYQFTFKAWGDGATAVEAKLALSEDPYEPVLFVETVTPGNGETEYSFEFVTYSDEEKMGLAFGVGGDVQVCIDDVVIARTGPPPENLISNGDFSSGTSGWEGGDGAPEIDAGRGCRNGGLFGWAGEGSGATVPAGNYTFTFKAWGDGETTLEAKFALSEDPYEPVLFTETVTPGSSETDYSFGFTVESNQEKMGLAFGVGADVRMCIDDVSITPN